MGTNEKPVTYFPVTGTNKSLAFQYRYEIFHAVLFSRLPIDCSLIIFNNGEVTNVLAWPLSDFRLIKNVCIWITCVLNSINKVLYSIGTVNVQCAFMVLQTHQVLALSTKRRVTWLRLSCTYSDAVRLVIRPTAAVAPVKFTQVKILIFLPRRSDSFDGLTWNLVQWTLCQILPPPQKKSVNFQNLSPSRGDSVARFWWILYYSMQAFLLYKYFKFGGF